MSAAGPARARVLHIITGLNAGGAEASLVRVIGESRDADHAVVSLTGVGVHGARLVTRGIPVYALNLRRGALAPSAILTMRSIVREFAPTCVQGWMYHGSLAASLLRLSGARTGPIHWNIRHALDAWEQESRALRAIVRALAAMSRLPQTIVYNSERAARQHEARGYAVSRTRVIPNGVDTSRFFPDRDSGLAIRQSLQIPPTARVVGMIARVDPLKDHDTFLQAASQLAAERNDTYFLLAGSDTAAGTPRRPAPLDAAIAALTAKNPGLCNRIVQLGERAEIPAIINACDIVTLTSRSEGSPNAIAEAMACGVPCVATDVGDTSTLLGAAGIVVPVGDASSVVQAWRALLSDADGATARSTAGVARIAERYTASAERAAYANVWQASHVLPGSVSEAPASTVPSVNSPADPDAPRLLMVTTVATTVRSFLLPFADHYRARGWQVDALAAGAANDRAVTQRVNRAFDIEWARNPLSPRNLAAVRRIRAVVQQGAYDIVHVHTPVAAFVTRFALRHMSRPVVIYTAHGFHADRTAPAWANLLFRTLERVAGRWTDHLVTINDADYALAQRDQLVAPGRLHAHPGIGVDLRHYRALAPAQRRSARRALDVPDRRSMFAVVGEFIPRKRQRDVIDAVQQIVSRGATPPCVLFLGDGPTRVALEQRVASLGLSEHVRFLGYRTDVAEIVAASDALVLCSAREGLPRCVLEAMAMEVPVLGSDAKGTIDLLRDDRGSVVPVGNARALAEAMLELMQRSAAARQRAKRASVWVRTHCDQQVLLDAHDALYDQALGIANSPGTLRHSGVQRAIAVSSAA